MMPPGPNDMIPPPDEEGCPAIYAQDLLPTFQLTMHPAVWEQLKEEWNHGLANKDMGLEYNPYHPLIEFRYEDVVIKDAAIRLKGNTSHWTPLPGDKMQFQIGFHTVNKQGHFWGLRRLSLDAATFNRHMLRDRLSLRFMREVGIRAPCANNARIEVNGEYYGIFTNIEKNDEVYLKRVMEDPAGDLWDRHNWEIVTNEKTATKTRLNLLRNAKTLAELEAILDVEQALRVYAAEAVIPNSDGAWAGGLNYFFYDDPKSKKFMLLPWDLDNTLDRFPVLMDPGYPQNPDPVVWQKPNPWGRPWYDVALKSPTYFALYIDIIDEILHEGYEPAKILGWIDDMSEQIEQAVLSDVNKPYTNMIYQIRLQALRDFVAQRYDFVEQWLVCWQTGGVNDGMGYCKKP